MKCNSESLFALLPAVLICLFSSVCVAQDEQESKYLSDRELILHTLSRITFGADDDLLERVESIGLKTWLERQFAHPGMDKRTAGMLAKFGSLNLTSEEIYKQYAGDRKKRGQVGPELKGSIVIRATLNNWQVAEVMTEFWRNHLNIDRAKSSSLQYTATHYEQEVLRKHVFGDFHSMLSASAKHPAMLVYLDNHISRKPPTKTELKSVARRVRQKTGSKERGQEAASIAAQRGLNENYARELMELHTLGVDNGYTQKDVVEVARALTGWTINLDKQKYEFLYQESMHDGGDKFVLGRMVPREKRRNGIVEGEKILARLATHKNTAQFLAKKLCIYLITDEPPQKLINQVAGYLKRSKFDLGITVQKILNSDEFRSREYFGCKFKTPMEFVISCLRAVDAEISSTTALTAWLEEMGQPIYGCEDPTGFSDTAESWRDPGIMAFRWKFALDLVQGKIKGVRIPDAFYAGMSKARAPHMVKKLGDKVLPGGIRSQTIRTLLQVVKKHRFLIEEENDLIEIARMEKRKPPRREKRVAIEKRLLAVLLGSPEFQRQ
ncbi:MAG: hypothetical protein ACI97A_002787 [Planctomycetota bacterium]|jgi:uncharacterized protein (DUF1800 family)